jgi:YesN/AraC family two-component response regulator
MNVKKVKKKSLSDRVVEYVLSRDIDQLAVLTVEKIAFHLQINRSHMSRTFKAERCFTIEEFLFKIKIIRSASMLKEEPQKTIKEVSHRIGFSRCDYFIRIFKQYFGTTPARYRDLISHQNLKNY